jgi:hypothetical protein
MANHARANLWRVPEYIRLDDLLQDGHMHWQRLVLRYPEAYHPGHRMALFKRTYANYIHDLARKRSRDPQLEYLLDDPLRQDTISNLSVPDTQWIETLVDRAPPAIRALFQLLTTENGRRAMRAHCRVWAGGTRQTFNEKLCALVGCDPTCIDLVGEIKLYLSEDT